MVNFIVGIGYFSVILPNSDSLQNSPQIKGLQTLFHSIHSIILRGGSPLSTGGGPVDIFDIFDIDFRKKKFKCRKCRKIIRGNFYVNNRQYGP